MIKLNPNDIESIASRYQWQKESITLSPTDFVREMYWTYRHFYVTLVNLYSTDLRVSIRAFEQVKKALEIISRSMHGTMSLDFSTLFKSELAILIFSRNLSYSQTDIEQLQRRMNKAFKWNTSIHEFILMHRDYERFLMRLYSQEKQTSWDDQFHTALFTLYHMYLRETEIRFGSDRLSFVHPDDVTDEFLKKKISSERLPALAYYSDVDSFNGTWMRLLLLEMQNLVHQKSTPRIARKISEPNSDLHLYIARQHRNLVESFCSLLLRCTCRRSTEAQRGFIEISSSHQNQIERRSAYTSSLRATEHTSTSHRLLDVDWEKRRFVQLRFFLRSESVNQMQYRKQILISELPLDRNGLISVESESTPSKEVEWIGNTESSTWTVQEEAKARQMVNFYLLFDRKDAPVNTPRQEDFGYGNDRIDESAISLSRKSLRLFL